jgi:hypothetical protein
MQASPGGSAPAIERNETTAQFVMRRKNALWNVRSSWIVHWLELADFILPRKGRLLSRPNSNDRGLEVNRKILDPTGTLAARTAASGMVTGLTSPARPWFTLGLADPDASDHGPIRQWLDVARQRIMAVLAGSNFYAAMHQLREEEVVFGTGVILCQEDRQDVVRFYSIQAGEYLLAQSSRAAVDTLYRDYAMTVQQMVQQFGYDACSPTVRSAYDQGNLSVEREVIHAIEPNPAMTHMSLPGSVPGWSEGFQKGYPYRCVYYEVGAPSDQLLGESGYHEQPFAVARWNVFGNDAYGRSPGMDVLGDVKSLQILRRRMAQGIDRQTDPPMVAPKTMEQMPITLLPGGVNFLPPNEVAAFRPIYQVQVDLRGMRGEIEALQHQVREGFFADLFLMISQMDSTQPVTAEEIRARQEEKLLQLGPVVERDLNELLSPLIERVFRILLRRQMIPVPPRELHGQTIKVDYISTLAQAQRATSTTSIEAIMTIAGRLASNPAWEPMVSAKIDPARLLDHYADATLVPPDIVIDDDAAQAIVAKRQQQAQAQQQGQAALAAVQGAQTLSKTDVGGGQNALAAILGNNAQSGPPPQ